MKPSDARLAVQKMMAEMEADMLGYKITECDTLWNTFGVGTKAKWLYYNVVVPSKGQAVRLAVDLRNAIAQRDAEDDEFVEREKYPPYAEPDPKGVISIKCNIKLNKPIEFIEFRGVLAQLTEAEKKNEIKS